MFTMIKTPQLLKIKKGQISFFEEIEICPFGLLCGCHNRHLTFESNPTVFAASGRGREPICGAWWQNHLETISLTGHLDQLAPHQTVSQYNSFGEVSCAS